MVFEEDLTILKKTIERINKGLKKSVDTSFLIDITEQVEKELNLEKRHKLKDFLKKELQEIEMNLISFSPMINFDELHSPEDFRFYIRNIQKYAVYTHCLLIINNKKLTEGVWSAVETFVCKAYNIYYCDIIKGYCYKNDKIIGNADIREIISDKGEENDY